ncbi:MAG TPA: glutamate-1-semialdehyde 2,1-aminomutase [Candidatus Acidoferrales bacterium]|nr:glutamate-1-semialdehyde 2,1-aminomutase [Candidatus Acidoferrales bacterium]
MTKTRSDALFAAAQQLFPGGVNSPVRAFRSVGGTPRFLTRGEGARVFDADGREYIDYVMSWGPLIAGHAHPSIVTAVARAAADGTTFGAPNERELELARLIQQAMPSLELMRFVSSGTEAAMSALRLCRAYTKRDLVLKFAGCYHGHADAMLVDAGSGALAFGCPSSPGVPAAAAGQTIVIEYNDTAALRDLFAKLGDKIACAMIEPIAANMGLVLPDPDFLRSLRELTEQHGTLLVFDEVITGFRIGLGGAQARFGIVPDLTCLGKIIGGGLPVGAFGGRADVMRHLSPLGDVYQAGTLSGNPVAMAAGAAQLRLLQEPNVYERLEQTASVLETGLRDAFASQEVAVQLHRVGSIFGVFFSAKPVKDLSTVRAADAKAYARFFHAMLERGVYLAPSAFEVGFVSLAHSPIDVESTVAAASDALSALHERSHR